MLCVLLCLWEVRVACHFSFLCCVFCFCLWRVRVAYYFSFLCCVFCFCLWRSVLFIILVFCVVCFVFVCGGSGGWVSVLLVILVFCVVCFVFVCWESVLLIILVFCVVCFVFVCGGPCCLSFYLTVDQGVWNNSQQASKAADRVKNTVLPAASEYGQQILKTSSDLTDKFPKKWNSGVQTTFQFIADSPEYGKKALTSTKELVKKLSQ